MQGLLGLRAALAIVLYAFLGVGFYVLWRGMSQSKQSAQDTCSQPARLIVESGEMEGANIRLHPITAVGRADDNLLRIEDPFASANHALIAWREEQWWLEDLDSYNGTWINEDRITHPTPLMAGDRFRIGETVIRFELE